MKAVVVKGVRLINMAVWRGAVGVTGADESR